MELNQVTKTNIVIMSKWMKFVGIVNIVLGAMACASCFGAIYGWIPILLGVWTVNSSKNFKLYADENNEQAFDQAIYKLKNIYIFNGVLTIISLVFIALYIILIIIAVITGAFNSVFQEGFKGLFN
ncbi:MAG: hypothetical protein JXB50_02780 [Spirochaetes bacterium]|nr:hypothetical protein [Spirochaetota bacterium]